MEGRGNILHINHNSVCFGHDPFMKADHGGCSNKTWGKSGPLPSVPTGCASGFTDPVTTASGCAHPLPTRSWKHESMVLPTHLTNPAVGGWPQTGRCRGFLPSPSQTDRIVSRHRRWDWWCHRHGSLPDDDSEPIGSRLRQFPTKCKFRSARHGSVIKFEQRKDQNKHTDNKHALLVWTKQLQASKLAAASVCRARTRHSDQKTYSLYFNTKWANSETIVNCSFTAIPVVQQKHQLFTHRKKH